MKRKTNYLMVVLLSLLLTAATTSASDTAQISDYCKGWDAGYQDALEDCFRVGLTPLCPLPELNRDRYRNGYVDGYVVAQKICEQ